MLIEIEGIDGDVCFKVSPQPQVDSILDFVKGIPHFTDDGFQFYNSFFPILACNELEVVYDCFQLVIVKDMHFFFVFFEQWVFLLVHLHIFSSKQLS